MYSTSVKYFVCRVYRGKNEARRGSKSLMAILYSDGFSCTTGYLYSIFCYVVTRYFI